MRLRTMLAAVVVAVCAVATGSTASASPASALASYQFYVINGLVMDASNHGGHGTPVILWTNNNGSNQIWNTEAASEGGTYLHPAYNWGLCLDFDGASPGNSIPVKVNNCDGSASQRWFFGNHPSGGYRIATHSDFRYCVDVPNYNFAQGQQIALWDCNDTTAQLWLT